jgi:cytochrome b involved in lipid metabolism
MDYVFGWKGELGLKQYGSWSRYLDLSTCFLLDEQTPEILKQARETFARIALAPTPKPVSTTASYTLAQVATHSSASSCWSIVRSNVYDLTSWIDQHPGGAEAILSMCGRDATTDFENQHGGQRRPENELQGFEIGTYKK